jgi:hypothetical protein
MAITYPLALPTASGIRSIELRMINAVAVSQSPFTFATQVQAYGGEMWQADVTLPPMKRATAEAWIAFLASLRGQFGTFLLGDPNGATPRGAVGGTPLVNNGAAINAGSFVVGDWYEIATAGDTDWSAIGAASAAVGTQFIATGVGSGTGTATAGQTGATLALDGATNTVTGWLKAGDYIQLGSAGTSTLHKVLKDANSDGSGVVSLDIWPAMRRPPLDNSAVVTSAAKGRFRLTSNEQSWSINQIEVYGITFGAMEAI